MRILLAHNKYGSAAPSGENQIFEAERELLENAGHEVEIFTRYSDEIRTQGMWGLVQGALATPWNPMMFRKMSRAVTTFQPDVVHVHNTFPLISPAIFHAVGCRAAKLLTLHNYRLFCPAAIPLRNGLTCTDCMDDNSVIPALRHGCYRDSRLATLPVAINVALHRALGTWTRNVDAFITLSDFQRNVMTASGLPTELTHVKPNFYPGKPVPSPWLDRKPYFIFAGRLTIEKGVISLVRAWQEWGVTAPELRILGDGELRPQLERMAVGLPVRFLGKVSETEAQDQIATASLLILPSEWFEGFPMVVQEAFAHGTPVAVSRIGPLPSIVRHGVNGVVFRPADPQCLLAEVRKVWETPGLLQLLGQAARKEFETKYTQEANLATLMDIYQQAMIVNQNRKYGKIQK